MNYKKGSEWRKWDLHIHTPFTRMNDNYKTNGNEDIWKEFCDLIESSNVAVLGITDYFSAENYFTFLKKQKEYYPHSKKVFFPNIELRLEVSVNRSAEEVNLHIIFADDVPYEKISEFLQKLDTNITRNAAIVSCFNLQPSDIKSAAVDYKIIKSKLKEVFGTEKKYLIFAAANNAGLRPDTNSPRKLNVTDEIDKICDGFFGGNQNCNYYLNKNRYESQEEAIAKPVVSCSDAHSFDDLKNWLGKRAIGNENIIEKDITWIKADPTFEGLKQIIYEPDKRVFIGEFNPYEQQRKICISKIEFNDTDKFPIQNQELEFNRDLVCLIGGRGSGKSALFESIAFCFDQHKSNTYGKLQYSVSKYDKKTFIDYYKDANDVNIDIKLHFTDKDFDALPIYTTSLKSRSEICTYPFLYLGQNQIEFYADNPEEIHRIAFDTVLKQTTLSGDLFSFQSKIEQKKQELLDSNKEIERLRLSISSYDEKKLEEDQKRVESELKLLSSKETKDIIDEFNSSRVKRDYLRQLEELIGEVDVSAEELSTNPKGKIQVLISDYEKELSSVLSQVNELAKQLNSNAVTLVFNLSELETQITTLKGSIDKANITKEYEDALIRVNEKLKGKTELSVSYLESQKNKETDLKLKIEVLQKLKINLSEKEDERELILTSLHQLYQDYEQSYSSAIQEFNNMHKEVLKSVNMEAKRIFQIDRLVSNLWDMTDGRKSKSKTYFKEDWMGVTDEQDFELISWYKNFISKEENHKVFINFDRNQIDTVVFSDYNSLVTNISYEIEQGDFKPIHQLSLGQKGTVLLKFYLASGNDCPILIDQPEDHLDNDFIYRDLVQTIHNAKERRQILIVTHDANIVVNGDAEQVIVANYQNQMIDHSISGSLENSNIRNCITRILEGGEKAFRKREKKYQFEN